MTAESVRGASVAGFFEKPPSCQQTWAFDLA
jgi:hypothetical protein